MIFKEFMTRQRAVLRHYQITPQEVARIGLELRIMVENHVCPTIIYQYLDHVLKRKDGGKNDIKK